MPNSPPPTTGALLARLQRHYLPPQPMPGGIFVPECGWNGGAGSRCDAVYVGFTSTSGRIMVGHELKISRADWRRELDHPGKADPWHDAVHAWYIVAPSADVVPVEEVPHGWGLMVPNTRTTTRMQILVKAADKPPDWSPPWNAVRSVMARHDTLRAQAIAKIEREAETKAREKLQADATYKAMRADPELERALTVVREIEQGTGLALLHRREDDSWAPWEQVARPVEFLAALRIAKAADGVAGGYDGLMQTSRRLGELREKVDKAVADVKALTSGDLDVDWL